MVVIRHTYNLVDLPIVIAGKTGTARVRTPDRTAAAVPLVVRRLRAEGPVARRPPTRTASRPSSGRTRELAVLVLAYDSGTLGNAATEIAKYFFQLHFDIKKDYRNFDLHEARQLLRDCN